VPPLRLPRQVLPPSMIKFAEPNPRALVNAIGDAIPMAKKVVPADFHKEVRTNAKNWCKCIRPYAMARKVVPHRLREGGAEWL
jgi:hypothetical protein